MSKKPVKALEAPVVKPHGDLRVLESRGSIETLRINTFNVITEYRTATDAKENSRRILEEKARKDRTDQIQTETITSHKKNIEIDWTWQELEEKEDCEELARDIEVQKEACRQIIAQKEDLIKSFMEQLKAKDTEYVQSLKLQNENIDKLISTMQEQFLDMRTQYRENIQNIEAAFFREQQEILARNEDEIKKLMEDHKKQEDYYQQKRENMEKQYLEQLEELKTQQANDQAAQKIQLDKEIQTLQKCMEDMKAVYALNQEKLEFNHKVLKERERVNTSTKESLKKRERKFQEVLRVIIDKYETMTKKYEHANKIMTKDYKKFTKEFLLLQKKYERFEKSDKTRFNEIWSMNQNEVQALCEKIKQCDEVIHVQQLGLEWQPPTDPILRKPEAGGISQIGAAQNTSAMESSKHGMSKSDFVDDGQMSNSTGQNIPEGSDAKEQFYKVKNVFDILIAEASYLIDEKVFALATGKPQKEAFLLLIDSIRKSLGIESMEDVQLLVQTFYEFGPKKKERLALEEAERIREKEEGASQAGGAPIGGAQQKDDKKKKDEKGGKEGTKDQKKGNQPNGQETTLEDEDNEERDPLQPDIEMDDVCEALEEFLQIREERNNNLDLHMNLAQPKKKNTFQSEEAKQESQKKQEKMYWERMTNVLSEKGLSVWRALDKALTKYYALLVERQNLIEETGLLNQQNEELKTLLNQYLQAGVNHDLQVPPTQVIRLDI